MPFRELTFLSFGAPVGDGREHTRLLEAQSGRALPIMIQPQLSRELEGGGGHIKRTQASNVATQSRMKRRDYLSKYKPASRAAFHYHHFVRLAVKSYRLYLSSKVLTQLVSSSLRKRPRIPQPVTVEENRVARRNAVRKADSHPTPC